jgi:hypothetical protein
MKKIIYLTTIFLLFSCTNNHSNNEQSPDANEEVTTEQSPETNESYSESQEDEPNEDVYEGEKCNNCNFGKYYDGICNTCSAASPSKVEEVYSKLPTCRMCYGDGTLENSYGETICDYCEGTGKQRI